MMRTRMVRTIRRRMTHRDMRIHRRLRVRMRVCTLSEQEDDRRRSTCILRMRKRVRTSAERRDASCRSERIPMMRIPARSTMVRTVMRMIQRIQRVQQGAVSRTTMRPNAPGCEPSSTDGGNGRTRRRHRRRSYSSTDADDTSPEVRRRHRIKPLTFDGTGSFESFWAQFENCASYNRWSDADKLAHASESFSDR